MYSQNNETGVLEILQIDLFCCSTTVGRPLQITILHLYILQFCSGIFIIYLKMKKLKNL